VRGLLLALMLVGSAAGQGSSGEDPPVESVMDPAATELATDADPSPSPSPTPAPQPELSDDGADWTTTDLAHLGLTESQGQYATLAALSFWFFARDDEVLTDARVRLRFSTRPALYKDLEAVEIRLNDEPVQTLTRSALLREREPIVRLDSRLLSARNSLTIRLIGTPAGACEDQVPRGAWRVLEGGQVETQGRPLPLPDDLAILPLPFVDPETDREVEVPVVYPSVPGRADIEAAMIFAGWTGTRSSAPATFPIAVGTLPPTSAVVFVSGEAEFDLLIVPPTEGPTLRLMDHPRHPGTNRKLLIVQGRDDAEMIAAARTLALRTEPLNGPVAVLEEPPPSRPRRPYDSPRWLPPSQTVEFSDVPGGHSLLHSGLGGGTMELQFRIAPDLFTWPKDQVPLSIEFSHLAPTVDFVPRVTVELNGEYVGVLPTPQVSNGLGSGAQTMMLHRSWLRGFNRLQFHVSWPDLNAPCEEIENLGGGIETKIAASSSINFEGIPHFSRMPDVATFIDDGFPFTRFADLAATAVVLPDEPAGEDLSTLLSLISHIAGVTGYAAPRAPVFFESQVSEGGLGGRDLLVVGNVGSLILLAQWDEHLPLRNLRGRLMPRVPSLLEQISAGLGGHLVKRDSDESGEILARSSRSAVVMGLQSPLSPGRSAIVVSGSGPEGMPAAKDLIGYTQARGAGGDLLMVDSRGARFRFRIGPRYDVGALSWFTRLRWVSANHWLVLLPAVVLIGLLLAGHTRARLLRLHYRRLHPEEFAS
jgi:cellulose synthase operon protein B